VKKIFAGVTFVLRVQEALQLTHLRVVTLSHGDSCVLRSVKVKKWRVVSSMNE
jgi:hypothetical protein